MAFARRYHQCALLVAGLARVNGRACGHQARSNRGDAGTRGEHQRCLTGLIEERHVRTRPQQQLDRPKIAVRNREV